MGIPNTKINLDSFVEVIKKVREQKGTVFVCGNGGSSSTAEHFSNDLFSKGVRSFCLNSNTSIITMIANDFGYENIFSKQLEIYADKDDIVIVFSCSGTSKNIVKIFEMNITSIGIIGGEGNYGDMENNHLYIAHRICESL